MSGSDRTGSGPGAASIGAARYKVGAARGLRGVLAVVVALVVGSGFTGAGEPAAAQPPSGRATGLVAGPDDRPIAGARVRIWPAATPAGVSETTTGADGRWRLVGLEPGRWQIEITVEGHFPAEGWFQVLASRPETVVDVELRSLAETSPSFAENASTIVRWVEKGNVLLEQGQPAAARVEYEKAVRALPRERRPEVLQAIARTHFLEGETDRAIERLQEALGIAPDDEPLEQLFRSLLASLGRADEADALLEAAAAAREPAPVEDPAAPEIRRKPELGPVLEAIPGRTGRFRTAFVERSPLSDPRVYLERFRLAEDELRAADPAGGAYDLAEESFALFVPESEGDEALGLFVWISPTPVGGFGNPEFERVLTERGLIWIGAHDAGNGRWGWYRVGLALDAVHNARRLYPIDERRIYVAGYSGGGRIASQLSMLYSDVFSGGFFLYGCEYFEPLPVPDRPGALWPARFEAPSPEIQKRLKASSRFVFLTGDADFNRSQTKQVHKRMRERGFQHLTYLQIPDADHYFGLPPARLERGLEALDASLE